MWHLFICSTSGSSDLHSTCSSEENEKEEKYLSLSLSLLLLSVEHFSTPVCFHHRHWLTFPAVLIGWRESQSFPKQYHQRWGKRRTKISEKGRPFAFQRDQRPNRYWSFLAHSPKRFSFLRPNRFAIINFFYFVSFPISWPKKKESEWSDWSISITTLRKQCHEKNDF